jgi:23S rRNA pseudouridine1911/1915/1917 synthase
MAVVRNGKPARTHYTVLRRFAHTALLELRLESGRTHQIRVHLANIGHPVLGDRTYGGDDIRSGPDTRMRRAFFRNLFEDLPRQALHARALDFVHPGSGEAVAFESHLPEDFSRAIERLERDR